MEPGHLHDRFPTERVTGIVTHANSAMHNPSVDYSDGKGKIKVVKVFRMKLVQKNRRNLRRFFAIVWRKNQKRKGMRRFVVAM
jgi:hypothetical protein